jgi:hypothetical protein
MFFVKNGLIIAKLCKRCANNYFNLKQWMKQSTSNDVSQMKYVKHVIHGFGIRIQRTSTPNNEVRLYSQTWT